MRWNSDNDVDWVDKLCMVFLFFSLGAIGIGVVVAFVLAVVELVRVVWR